MGFKIGFSDALRLVAHGQHRGSPVTDQLLKLADRVDDSPEVADQVKAAIHHAFEGRVVK